MNTILTLKIDWSKISCSNCEYWQRIGGYRFGDCNNKKSNDERTYEGYDTTSMEQFACKYHSIFEGDKTK